MRFLSCSDCAPDAVQDLNSEPPDAVFRVADASQRCAAAQTACSGLAACVPRLYGFQVGLRAHFARDLEPGSETDSLAGSVADSGHSSSFFSCRHTVKGGKISGCFDELYRAGFAGYSSGSSRSSSASFSRAASRASASGSAALSDGLSPGSSIAPGWVAAWTCCRVRMATCV